MLRRALPRVLLALCFLVGLCPAARAFIARIYTLDEVMQAGERIWNLERVFNVQAGFSGKDDTLPRRMLSEPMPSGPAKGNTVPLDKMLPEYYRLRGWDSQGKPTKKRLAALGL